MSPQLEKEVRLLLPVWAASVLLVALPAAWVANLNSERWEAAHEVSFDLMLLAAAYVIGLLLLTVSVIGREFSGRTFQFLLSQPIPRTQIWKRKIKVLGLASGCLWLIFWTGMTIGAEWSWRVGLGSLVVATAIVGTGLAATLLFRQVLPAFAFSLLPPSLLVPIVSPMAASNFPTWIFLAALVFVEVYAVSMFRLSQGLFLRAQDLDPWLANLSLNFTRNQERGAYHPSTNRSPLWSLLRKEAHLHQVNLLCGTLLLVLLAGMQLLFGQGERSPAEGGIAIGYVLATLFMPLLVGSMTIAEERKLGILTGQHCLPISTARQFWVKAMVTGGATVLLGVVAPITITWMLLRIGGFSIGEGAAEKSVLASAMGLWLGDKEVMGILFLLVYAIVAGTISLYASSLSRSAMGALVLTLVFLFGSMFASLAIQEFWTGGQLLVLISIPVGVLLLTFLAFRNFTQDLIDARVRRQNFVAIAGLSAVVILATSFTHYRTWELILPEPTLGPSEPLLANGAQVYPLPELSQAFIHLPDGRLWISDRFDSSEEAFSFPENGHFLIDRDWLEVAASGYQLFGIRGDGTLWHIFESTIEDDKLTGRLNLELLMEGRWRDLAAGRSHALALREDGTIWGWGYSYGFQVGKGRRIRIETPQQIGKETDWVAVQATDGVSLGVKQNASVWLWNDRADQPLQLDLPVGEIHSVSGPWGRMLAVMEDGTLWGWGEDTSFGLTPQQLGEKKNWKAANIAWWIAVFALREDGSLWSRHVLPPVNDQYPLNLEPTEPASDRSRWSAIRTADHGMFALGDDGSLWIWPYRYWYNQGLRSLFVLSRWPTPVEQFVIE